MYGVTIMGNNSAIPAFDRHPTAQALHWDDQVFLIDCGEGTQMQISRYKIRRNRINHIFISHLHGDHYFGLIGLITSMGLLGREQPLHIYAPSQLQAIIQTQLDCASTTLPYTLHFHALAGSGVLLEEKHVTVSCFEVKHRIPTWGFLFKEKKPPRSLVKEAAIQAGIPEIFFNRLKWGEDYTNKQGEIIPNESVTTPARPPLSYAYCADTLYEPGICEHIQEVTVLYHEATFLEEQQDKATDRFHSTAKEAALIAKAAQAKQLLIGHFSSRYEILDQFEEEACTEFAQTALALEGVTYLIKH
ncbi:MAG TPA: ribonuclease Z [Phnomibacter sp.]|nr:ribonuclease Z [Phnomibacter sp.]